MKKLIEAWKSLEPKDKLIFIVFTIMALLFNSILNSIIITVTLKWFLC